MKLSILIPAFNEEKTIEQVVNHSFKELSFLQEKKLLKDFEIIIVNDGSKDQTGKIVKKEFQDQEKIKIIEHMENQGKGAAIITALEMASGDYILIQDADLEYNPKDYESLWMPIKNFEAEVVFGSRFRTKPAQLVSFYQIMGNKLLTKISNIFTGFNLTDMETGYKLIKTSLIKNMNLKSNDFRIEPEITAKLSTIPGVRIKEIAISYKPRTYGEGKKIRLKDGILALIYILKYSKSQLNKY
ncbi:MAG: glycosyltransferase family 2 protein [Epsilonproteobacteria bacterium]|nr:MAG: glycosyltransferase family 2 protein [Campylobacterota bacterium]RLA67007.1 MAG: glycosyltransferase family 2 protein [Campylobacterota bacterium]